MELCLVGCEQYVRHCDVLSSWLYISYDDDLLVEIEDASVCCHIANKFYGAPMQADDLALLAISKCDMDNMLNNLKMNMAHGKDNLINEYFMASIDILVGHIFIIFNAILVSGFFPDNWAE